jgi:hypothetical protein
LIVGDQDIATLKNFVETTMKAKVTHSTKNNPKTREGVFKYLYKEISEICRYQGIKTQFYSNNFITIFGNKSLSALVCRKNYLRFIYFSNSHGKTTNFYFPEI